MNFQVRKKELLDSLNISVRAVSSTTPLPILSGIKFDIKENELVLISSDSNISIKTILNNNEKNILTVNEIGSIVIDAKYILEIVRKIDSEYINFEIIDGNLIKIFSGNSEFKINGMNADEYPNINFSSEINKFKMLTKDLAAIIDQTIFACSDKDVRPILTGLNLKAHDGKLYANATDSYRLATKSFDLTTNEEFNITIPAKYLLDVSHSLSETKEVEIAIDNQKIIFSFDNSVIETRLLDDVFPDTSKLIPTSFTQELIISARDLANAIDRSSFIKSDGKNIVKLNISNKSVILTSSNQIGSSYETINVISFSGNPFEISCSGKYLIDAIKALGSNEVKISFSGELKPLILTNENDSSIIQLISPVRTYK